MDCNYNATLKVDDNLSFDEKRNLFCYNEEGFFVVLPAENIESCQVVADIDSMDISYFNKEFVEGIGDVHFVKDTDLFSEALMKTEDILSVFFYNKEHKMVCYRKKYSSRTKEAYDIMSRINKIIVSESKKQTM